jgi:aspartate/methionine/tyrosine aminotransferase
VLECKAGANQAGMFVWAAIPQRYKSSYELSDKILYDANVFITPGGIFGKAGEKYVRVSLCSTEEKLMEAINRVQKIKS